MHIPLLSNIAIKKHLSHPGVPEEAAALLQEMKTYPVRKRGTDEEGYDGSQEYIEIAGRSVSPHCLAALNGICQMAGSQNGFQGKMYFVSPAGQNTTQLCGPAFTVDGSEIKQLPHLIEACERSLSKFTNQKQSTVTTP